MGVFGLGRWSCEIFRLGRDNLTGLVRCEWVGGRGFLSIEGLATRGVLFLVYVDGFCAAGTVGWPGYGRESRLRRGEACGSGFVAAICGG